MNIGPYDDILGNPDLQRENAAIRMAMNAAREATRAPMRVELDDDDAAAVASQVNVVDRTVGMIRRESPAAKVALAAAVVLDVARTLIERTAKTAQSIKDMLAERKARKH